MIKQFEFSLPTEATVGKYIECLCNCFDSALNIELLSPRSPLLFCPLLLLQVSCCIVRNNGHLQKLVSASSSSLFSMLTVGLCKP